MTRRDFDIVVIGGGHAGIEAALACARLGARCGLVTHDVREIGRMPCNPAIGGLGKGHLVREIDVLGGQMGLAIDQSGIQFRVLNRRKGPAVQSPRAQADKHAYQRRMMETTLSQEGLTVISADAVDLLRENGRVCGVALSDGRRLSCARAVLCSGTFLRGLMHVGQSRTKGGREGAAASEGLSGGLSSLGFHLKRLKTGTPPRLLRQSIDFSRLQPQSGDQPPVPFSFRTRSFRPDQVDCHLAYTGPETHRIIRENLDRSPLYAGAIEGRGPRYCPSIEDKVVRFADKERHLLFLEPEGRETDEIYVNGLSTSLPADVQEWVVHSVEGLADAVIVRYGYAVEYDSVPSWQVGPDLEARPLPGLFLAGQILGTSGYEEAAAQGLVAGINAARSLDGGSPLVFGRQEAYIGVLVDDLVTKDIDEPYRMFTSRAEHRLALRCDNVESRLCDPALRIGLLSAADQAALLARRAFVTRMMEILRKTTIAAVERGGRMAAADFLRLPETAFHNLPGKIRAPEEFWEAVKFETNKLRNAGVGEHVVEGALQQVVNDIKYDGYITKHNKLLHHLDHLDCLVLPHEFDYKALKSLSFEAREKLDRVRPTTMGQASRIDGVRAGDLAVLTVLLKKLAADPDCSTSRGQPPAGHHLQVDLEGNG